MSPADDDLTKAIQASADADHARQGVCGWCRRPGEPYEHRGVRFDGLTACSGDRLCAACRDRYLESTPLLIAETDYGVTRVYDINPNTQTEETEPPVRAIAAAYRYADYRKPASRKRASE
jgi:hypothetical protein